MQESTIAMMQELMMLAEDVKNRIENDTRAVLTRADTVEMVEHFVDIRDVNEQIKIVRKSLEMIEDRLSHADIPDHFKRTKTVTITVDGIGRASIGHRWGCSIIDRQVGHQWLRDNDHGGLITETVNSSTLAAFAKDLFATEGKNLPGEIFETSINPYVSITKG